MTAAQPQPRDTVPPGYKTTEVGVIPEDWEVRFLGQLASGIFRGASPRPIDSPVWFDDTSSVGWVRISDVTGSGRLLFHTRQRLSAEGIRNSRFVPSGALIMSICATVGRPIETRVDVCIHDGFVVFDRPAIFQPFLYYILKNLEPKWSESGQTGSQMNLNTALIRRTSVRLPRTETEQRAIATALSDVDELIESLEKLIAKKRAIKTGTMQQLLTPPGQPGHKRLPGFSGEWAVKRLGDLFGITSSKRVFQSEWRSAGIPFYRARELAVLGATGNVANELFITRDLYEKHRRAYGVPAIGDMLVTGVGTLGKTYVVTDDREFYFKDGNIIWFRIGNAMSAEFLRQLYLTKRVIDQVSEGAAGTTVGTYTITAAKNTTVPFPPMAEQLSIATILSDMDAEIEALEARLAKTRAIKQGMMQELLTGRTRLRQGSGGQAWLVKPKTTVNSLMEGTDNEHVRQH